MSSNTFRGFSLKESAIIRKQIITRGARLECPRCGGTLTLGNQLGGLGGGARKPSGRSPEVGTAAPWELRCDPCQRKLVLPRGNQPLDPRATP